MTEWEDLVLAVRCGWTEPADLDPAISPCPPPSLQQSSLQQPGDGSSSGYIRARSSRLGITTPSSDSFTPVPLPALPPVRSVDDFYLALRHAFETHRAGILVSIRAGKVALFLPFANDQGWACPVPLLLVDGTNNEGAHPSSPASSASSGASETSPLALPPLDVEAYAEAKRRVQEGRKARRAEPMLPDVSRWWFNGHVVCNVRPPNVWGDYQMEDLFAMVRSVAPRCPDVDFILNKRDCPLNTRTRQPVHHAVLPVLSPYTGPGAFDIPFPLADDWRANVSSSGRGMEEIADFPVWDRRSDSRAVFRGSSTGKGITETSNLRIRLALFAARYPQLFDFRITAINDRCQVVLDGRPMSSDNEGSLGGLPNAPLLVTFPNVVRLRSALERAGVWGGYESLQDQADRCWMAVYVRGHQAASRLGALFRHGFLVIIYSPHDELFEAPGCNVWFHHHLRPYYGWKLVSDEKPPTPDPFATHRRQVGSIGVPAPPFAALGGLPSSIAIAREDRPALSPAERLQLAIKKTASKKKGGETSATPTAPLVATPDDLSSSPLFTTALPNASHNCIVVTTPEELRDCVRVMQGNRAIAEMIARRGWGDIGQRVLGKQGMMEHAAWSIRQAAVVGRTKHVSPLTHSLFGTTNPETSKISSRFMLK